MDVFFYSLQKISASLDATLIGFYQNMKDTVINDNNCLVHEQLRIYKLQACNASTQIQKIYGAYLYVIAFKVSYIYIACAKDKYSL